MKKNHMASKKWLGMGSFGFTTADQDILLVLDCMRCTDLMNRPSNLHGDYKMCRPHTEQERVSSVLSDVQRRN